MRTFWTWALALAVPAVCVTEARPGEPIVPEGTAAKLILLRQKSVQKELKLSPEVTQKVRAFTKKQWEAAEKAMKLGEQERERKFDQLDRQNKEFLAANLTSGQRKRLNQITMQVTGLRQLTRPEVIRRLNLTDDQVGKIKGLQEKARTKLAKIMATPNRTEKNAKLAKLRAEVTRQVRALLTDDQRVKARELVGEPFTGELVFEEPALNGKSDNR
jgi:hypothetical protein